MNKIDPTLELQELIAATREHFIYLQELGVERIEVASALSAPEPMPVSSQPKPLPISTKSLWPETDLSGPAATTRQAESLKPTIHDVPQDSLFGDFAPPAQSLARSNENFAAIRADVGDCTRCPLHHGRTNIVHTEGDSKARLMFVGEAPGADEDLQARPFVGKAGQLLTKIIESIGFKREEVMIGNVNRCRPPGNRPPTTEEAATCKPFLLREIAVVQPEVIVVLGNTAIKNLLETRDAVTKLRGKFQDYKGKKVMPTFHPAYLLRDPSKKRETWEDLKKVRDYLDLKTTT